MTVFSFHVAIQACDAEQALEVVQEACESINEFYYGRGVHADARQYSGPTAVGLFSRAMGELDGHGDAWTVEAGTMSGKATRLVYEGRAKKVLESVEESLQ